MGFKYTGKGIIPEYITILRCYGTEITNLPALPEGLLELHFEDCWNTQNTSLPTLPQSLRILLFHKTQITTLPALSQSLQVLYCGATQITSLPALPEDLRELYCFDTPITELPALPHSLEKLYCDNEIIPGDVLKNKINIARKLEIQRPKDKIKELEEEIKKLKEQIRIMPGGEDYFKAMEQDRRPIGLQYTHLRNQALNKNND